MQHHPLLQQDQDVIFVQLCVGLPLPDGYSDLFCAFRISPVNPYHQAWFKICEMYRSYTLFVSLTGDPAYRKNVNVEVIPMLTKALTRYANTGIIEYLTTVPELKDIKEPSDKFRKLFELMEDAFRAKYHTVIRGDEIDALPRSELTMDNSALFII